MTEAQHLTQRYGHAVAVDEAFFDLTRDETDHHAAQLAGSSKGI